MEQTTIFVDEKGKTLDELNLDLLLVGLQPGQIIFLNPDEPKRSRILEVINFRIEIVTPDCSSWEDRMVTPDFTDPEIKMIVTVKSQRKDLKSK